MCLGGTPERGWEQGGLPELCPEDKRRSYSPWRTGWEAQDKGDPSPLELTPLGGVVHCDVCRGLKVMNGLHRRGDEAHDST